MTAQAIRRIVVRGRVQGVGFRAFVEDEAALYGLEGWIRNRRDGSVEAVLAGAADAVAAVVEACRQGPETARVEGIEISDGGAADLRLRRPGEHFSTLMTV